jgi:type IV secretion system protein VirB11
MLNPDGRLWIDWLSGGLEDSGRTMSAADGERIVRLVAHHVGAEVHAEKPRVSAELPETGERFEGLLPPVVAAPAFAIRKPAVAVFTLDDYAAAGIMTAGQAGMLREAVAARKNILVAGGTSTGKTTLTNALLAEIAGTTDRVVLIEDTRELQCRAPNLVALRTKDGVASLSDLVRSSLRLRPDRIPIGEVRGSEALELLKAWGTGHPGGIGTIHAGTALGALRRLEQLIQEAVVNVPRALIAETIDVIALLFGRGADRRLAELAGAAPSGRKISRQSVPRRGIGPGRSGTSCRIRGGGRALRVKLLPDVPLSAAGRRCRPRRTLPLRGQSGIGGRGCPGSVARLHRSDRPGAAARRGFHARERLAR